MLRKLMATPDDRVMFIIRVVAGLVILPHGLQKLLGWFGGFGFQGTMGFLTQQQHIPYVFALLAIIAEVAGGLGLITGLLGRVAAFGVFCVMVVAVITTHLPNGFFMNWTGQQKGEGFEYHLLMMALTVAVMIRGSGAWSLDRLLAGSGPRNS